jgi:hypothetical protein
MSYSGPYGAQSTFRRKPRFSFEFLDGAIEHLAEKEDLMPVLDGYISKVDYYQVEELVLPKKVDVEHVEGRGGHRGEVIDFEAEADQFEARSAHRREMLESVKSRFILADTPNAENVFELSESDLQNAVSALGLESSALREILTRNIVMSASSDIAAGQAEAMLSDVLDTDIEIDDYIDPFIAATGDADILGYVLSHTKHIPKDVMSEVLKDFLLKRFEAARTEISARRRLDAMRSRFSSKFENMVAGVAKSRN